MIVALHYCRKDQHLASKLAEWLDELGPFPNHQFLIARERQCDPMVFVGHKNLPVFNEIVIADDTANSWPASANHAFKKIAKHVQYAMRARPFLLLEPDAVVLRASAFDEIEVEYLVALREKKYFLGDLIDHRKQLPGSVLHMSGCGVFPGNMTQYAGEVFYADDKTPWDIVAGPAIHSQAKQSELIFHVWNQNGQGLAPFKDWSDVEAKIFARRPKCALFHSDKTGTLLGLLRERKNLSGGGGSRPASYSTVTPASDSEVANEGSGNQGPVEEQIRREVLGRSETQSAEVLSSSSMAGCGSSAPPTQNSTSQPESSAFTAEFLRDIYEKLTKDTPNLWADRDGAIHEIKCLAGRLRQFQTAPMATHAVRSLLAEAGVIPKPVKRRKRKRGTA
jgi:hypothetical protein